MVSRLFFKFLYFFEIIPMFWGKIYGKKFLTLNLLGNHAILLKDLFKNYDKRIRPMADSYTILHVNVTVFGAILIDVVRTRVRVGLEKVVGER